MPIEPDRLSGAWSATNRSTAPHLPGAPGKPPSATSAAQPSHGPRSRAKRCSAAAARS